MKNAPNYKLYATEASRPNPATFTARNVDLFNANVTLTSVDSAALVD